MQFGILGPLELGNGSRRLSLTAPKLRKVLALLLLQNNRMVLNMDLIDELWGVTPPPSAQSTLQTYIYKLRQFLNSSPEPVQEEMLQTKLRGYMIRIPQEDLDFCRFRRLSDEGRKALDNGDPEAARRTLSLALALWRGPALADVDVGEVLAAYVTRLEEDRVQALEARLEADLQLGRHPELISELKALTLTHPLHEGYHAKLMVALHGSGRRGEALDVYQHLRSGLVEELGLEPSNELQSLQRALLSSDPAINSVHRPTHVATQILRPAPPSLPRTRPPPTPEEELSEASAAAVSHRNDAYQGQTEGESAVKEPVVESTAFLVPAHDVDKQNASGSCGTSSATEMTKICEETAELLKEAIVTIASGVAKPLEWESDCASTLRQLTQVLGLVGTMREKLHAEACRRSR